MDNIYNLIFIFGAKYLYLAVIIIVLVWFLIQPRTKQKEILIISCICLPLAYLVAKLASHLYYNPRPFVLGHFKPLISHKANNGFPSHHALLVSAIAAVVLLFSWRISSVLWILTLFVGISRVYVGVHHPVDIIGSIFISVMVVTVIGFTATYFRRRNDK